MKIAFISDLHSDYNYQKLRQSIISPLIQKINDEKPNILLVGGDISGSAANSIAILEKIQEETDCAVYFIPGNHDIWVNPPNSSWDNYNLFKNHSTTLIDKPLILNNDWVVVSDMGWYDYSFGPEYINEQEFYIKKKQLWNDAKYAKWGMNDIELNSIMMSKFEEQLEKFKDKNVIFMNHFIPYLDFIVFKNDYSWNISNAFMGSEKIGSLLDKYPNVKYVLFGHTHTRFGNVEYGDKRIICNPLGYVHEWKTNSLEKEIDACFNIIDI